MVPRLAECQLFHCQFHRKESRYGIKAYPKDFLLVMTCLECTPPTEVARFKIAAEDAPQGNDHKILKARSFKVRSI